MRTAAQRIAKYRARMVSSCIDPTLSAINAAQLANYTQYLLDFYPNQVQLRNLLDAAGLQPIEYGAYEAYHGELYGLTKRFSGASLVAAKETLVAKWSDTQHIGSAAATLLNQIADVVYHITSESSP